MNQHLSPLLAALLAALLACTSGCKKPAPRPIKFNNEMARTNYELSKTGKAFRDALKPYLDQDKALTAVEMKGYYRAMEDALDEAKEKWDKMQAPKNSGAGTNLLEKYQEYLEQEGAILKIADQIVQTLQNPRLNGADRKATVKALVGQMNDLEGKALGPVVKVQEEFSKAHNLELKTAEQMKQANKK